MRSHKTTMMLLPSSTSTSLTRLLVPLILGVAILSVAAAQVTTPCVLGQAGCRIKKVEDKKKKDEKNGDDPHQHQPKALASNNNSSLQHNDTLSPPLSVSTLSDDYEAGNDPAEVHVNSGHDENSHHVTTQFDLSPPPPLQQEVDDDTENFVFPLLQERIASIHAYLHDPMFYLIDMDVDSYMQQADLSSYSIPPSNLVAILEDLEFHLEHNITMTREFYNLGGWHLVASLVSPMAHGSTTSSFSSSHDDNHNYNADVNDKILVIRAYATSLLGAIVKGNSKHEDDNENIASWVITPIQINDAHDMTTMRTTPLNLVAQTMVEVSSDVNNEASVVQVQKKCSDNTIGYQHQLAKECMHALEAFLHNDNDKNNNNKNAAVHAAHVAFSTLWTMTTPSSTSSTSSTVEESGSTSTISSSSSPAIILGHQVSRWTHEAATAAADTETSNAIMSRHSIDMATCLLRLVKDIVQDVDNIQQQQQQDDASVKQNQIILNVLSTRDWCWAAMQAATLTPSTSFKRLVFMNLQKTALQALAKLGPHCSPYYYHDVDKQLPLVVGGGVADLIRLHEQVVLQASITNMDNSKRIDGGREREREREFMKLVEEALAAVTTPGTTAATT